MSYEADVEYSSSTTDSQSEANLKEEVKLATGIQTSYTSLRNKARNAVIASKEMENTWQSLSDDLETLIGELKSGMTNAGQVERYKQ